MSPDRAKAYNKRCEKIREKELSYRAPAIEWLKFDPQQACDNIEQNLEKLVDCEPRNGMVTAEQNRKYHNIMDQLITNTAQMLNMYYEDGYKDADGALKPVKNLVRNWFENYGTPFTIHNLDCLSYSKAVVLAHAALSDAPRFCRLCEQFYDQDDSFFDYKFQSDTQRKNFHSAKIASCDTTNPLSIIDHRFDANVANDFFVKFQAEMTRHRLQESLSKIILEKQRPELALPEI